MKKKSAFVCCVLLCCALCFCACGSNVIDLEDESNGELLETAEEIVALVNERDYAAINAMVREDLAEALSEEVLQNALDPILDEAGDFAEYLDAAGVAQEDKDTGEAYSTIVLACSYQNNKVTYTISLDTDLAIVGFYVR